MRMNSMTVVATMIAAFTGGCAAMIGTETRFTPWSGHAVAQGRGGAVETVDGIEIWTVGTPERKYRIIGVVEQSRSDDAFDNLLFGRFNRSEVLTLVKQAGGNGLVTLKTERVGTAQAVQHTAVMAVFRYEP